MRSASYDRANNCTLIGPLVTLPGTGTIGGQGKNLLENDHDCLLSPVKFSRVVLLELCTKQQPFIESHAESRVARAGAALLLTTLGFPATRTS